MSQTPGTTAQARHTPGPLYVHPCDNGFDITTSPQPNAVAYFVATAWAGGELDDHAEANARLIAAAPEMLAMLREITVGMDRAGGDGHGMPECPWCKAGPDGDDHHGDCELRIARELIARIEGE